MQQLQRRPWTRAHLSDSAAPIQAACYRTLAWTALGTHKAFSINKAAIDSTLKKKCVNGHACGVIVYISGKATFHH